MRHVTHALRCDLRHLGIPLAGLKRNVTFIAVSLLVPLVGLGTLAVPPRIAQSVAAPLWNAIASPLGDLSARQILRPHENPSASASGSEAERAHPRKAANDVLAANVADGRQGPSDEAGGQGTSGGAGRQGPTSEPPQRKGPPSGGVVTEGDEEGTADTVRSGGHAGRDGDAKDGKRAREADDKRERGRRARPPSGSDHDCSPETPTGTVVAATAAAKATAAEAATAIVETTTALAAATRTPGPTLPRDIKGTVATTVAGKGPLGRP
jgi:hypothetical protein